MVSTCSSWRQSAPFFVEHFGIQVHRRIENGVRILLTNRLIDLCIELGSLFGIFVKLVRMIVGNSYTRIQDLHHLGDVFLNGFRRVGILPGR